MQSFTRVPAAFLLIVALTLATSPGCRRAHLSDRPGEVFDAGALFASSTPLLTHGFHVVNHSKRPVRILRENHSCDCTTVDLPKRELRPGESVTLTLSISIPPACVSRAVSTTLETDDPEHPNWVYLIRFEGFPDARIVPSIIELGSRTVADMLEPEPGGDFAAAEGWMEVFTPPKGKNHPPPRVINPPAECIVTVAETPEVSILASGVRAERYRLSVRLRQGVPSTGTFVRPLNITLNDLHGAAASLTWSVRAPVVCVPERIHLGSVALGDPPIKRRVNLQSADGKPFRIITVGHDAIVTIRPTDGGGFPSPASNRHALELVLEVPREPTSTFLAGSVRIQLDRRDYSEVSLPWSAIIRTRQAKSSARADEKPVFVSEPIPSH